MTLSAILTCLAVVFLWGIAPIFDKSILAHLDSRQLFLARFYLIFIMLLTPMVLYFDDVRVAVWRSDRRIFWALAGSVTTPVLGLYLYYRALGADEASKIVPFCASYPLITFILSSVLLKEPLTGAKLAGTALVVSGAWLLARP